MVWSRCRPQEGKDPVRRPRRPHCTTTRYSRAIYVASCVWLTLLFCHDQSFRYRSESSVRKALSMQQKTVRAPSRCRFGQLQRKRRTLTQINLALVCKRMLTGISVRALRVFEMQERGAKWWWRLKLEMYDGRLLFINNHTSAVLPFRSVRWLIMQASI